MDTKEEIKKSATSEITKTTVRLLLLLIGTLILASVPLVRDRIWPATPKGLLLALLVVFLSVILGLVPYALRLKRKLKQSESNRHALADILDRKSGVVSNSYSKVTEANIEIDALKKQIPSHENLDSVEIRILQLLALHPSFAYVDILASDLTLPDQRVQYHMDRLLNAGYVHTTEGTQGPYYELRHKGRDYLVKNDML